MTTVLELRFRNQEERITTIAVPDPSPTITAEDVETSMNELIQADVFTSTGGDLVTIVDARYVTRTVETVFEPEQTS
ncbi:MULTISPECIES: DUF2922 domain-containing protein [Geomicrobium]|uniref:DUF2922 domain-containing protein n=1 Tax=Geomicrobium sediminis TaxID=1347788 RepID=A0ABS2PIC4_9BACL|nr:MULTISPECIES: DUF2922 domain-containing protein [Geomicrobium]MBM7635180.1 hypothetical protein [Geomicrobium sediminis]GAK01705.1 hypothetical protein JCM19055_4909 [Geomicrobium sp. JCM 19055]